MNEKLKWAYKPKKTITVQEVAAIIPVLARMYAGSETNFSDLNRIVGSLPSHLKRHFTTREG